MQGLIQTKGVAHAHQGDARGAAKVRQHLSDELVKFCLVDHFSILPIRCQRGKTAPYHQLVSARDKPIRAATYGLRPTRSLGAVSVSAIG
jgi:hypothetical protein